LKEFDSFEYFSKPFHLAFDDWRVGRNEWRKCVACTRTN
jgi:hypothetical protein